MTLEQHAETPGTGANCKMCGAILTTCRRDGNRGRTGGALQPGGRIRWVRKLEYGTAPAPGARSLGSTTEVVPALTARTLNDHCKAGGARTDENG